MEIIRFIYNRQEYRFWTDIPFFLRMISLNLFADSLQKKEISSNLIFTYEFFLWKHANYQIITSIFLNYREKKVI